MSRPPHIIVFMTDDHGQWASSTYGNGELHTPTMQWLAETGTVMRSAYTPCPVCSPARASFWTGKIPSAHGIHDYIQEANQDPRILQGGILGQVHLGQLLQGRGYRTAMMGKWHAGGQGQPVEGFDVWFSSLKGTNARFGPQSYSDNGEPIQWHGHQSPGITQRAVRFLQDAHRTEPQRPVFLFVGYTDTHGPHDNAPPRLVEHYRRSTFADIPDERFAEAHGLPRFPMNARDAACREDLADYYASVEMIDQQMGAILDVWAGCGQLDQTVVLYTSDHGHLNGHHGLHSKGNATWPQNFLEESVLVPSLWRWPEKIHPGCRLDAPVDHCDASATLLDAGGSSVDNAIAADGVNRPGRSFLPMLQTGRQPWRDWQVCEYGNARMIRDARHKFIRRSPAVHYDASNELYDLTVDPRERIDLLSKDQGVAENLDDCLRSYFERYAVPEADGFDTSMIRGHFNSYEPWSYNPHEGAFA